MSCYHGTEADPGGFPRYGNAAVVIDWIVAYLSSTLIYLRGHEVAGRCGPRQSDHGRVAGVQLVFCLLLQSYSPAVRPSRSRISIERSLAGVCVMISR